MTRGIDGRTALYAVLGHPAAHSLSPRMQNAAFAALGLNAIYVALDVAPERLEEGLRGLHALGAQGLNVTTPHKEAAWRLVARRTREADQVGAVNTLLRESDGWHGDVTDGRGMDRWLHALRFDARGRRVLLLGTGGAARSIGPVLLARGPGALLVVGADAERAGRLVADWRVVPGASQVRLASCSIEEAARGFGADPWDLIVRARSALEVDAAETKIWARARASARVLDLNYGERAQPARDAALKAGLRYEDGLELLVLQGACSFEFWTGRSAPTDVMRRALSSA